MAKHATIDEYIAALPADLPAVAEAVRPVIDARLAVMAHTKLRSPQDVDEELFADWLVQAREFELAAGA